MSNTVPDGWTNRVVREFTQEHKQGYYTQNPYTAKGTYLIRITDLHNPCIRYEGMPKLDVSESEYQQFKVEPGDFLFARSGAIGRYGIVEKSVRAIFASYLIRFRFINATVLTRYFGYAYESDDCQKQLGAIIQGSSNVNINADNIKSLSVLLPPLPEQQKIAAILSSVDDVIEKTRTQIDKLKDLKTGMMQELLTKGIGHTEFKDSPVGSIPESWRHSTIGELVTKVGSGITPKGGSSSYVDFGVPLIRSQNVHPDGLRLDDVSYITDQQHQKMANSQLEPSDVLLNITGASIGRCYYLPADFGHGNVNQHVCIIRGKPNHIHPVFLTLFLNSEFGQRQIMSLQAGGNREGLNFQQVRAIKLPLPTLYEQQKIADSVSSIDQHIQKRRAKLSQANNLKKALMQDLLTGKVRVKVDQKESAVA